MTGFPDGRDARHPQAVSVLVIGIISVFCALIGPIAWTRGRRVVREIDASGGAMGGRSAATAGKVLGIIATLYLVVLVVSEIIHIAVYGEPW